MECCCLISEVGGREQGSCCLAFISARMSLPRSHGAVQTSSGCEMSALGKTERVVGEVSVCHFFSDGNIRLEWKKNSVGRKALFSVKVVFTTCCDVRS